MSALRILWPAEDFDTRAATPDVLPFRRGSAAPREMNVIERARTLYSNRRCRACSYPVVTPIELDDAVANRCGQPIPGTATLVGFRCHGCRTEWSV